MTAANRAKKFYLWRSRLAFVLTLSVMAFGFGLGGLADPPQDPPPIVVRVILLGVSGILLVGAGRALAMCVVVSNSRVTVKNVTRTIHMSQDDIASVVMPDDNPMASRSLIRTKSGAEVRLSAISRIKNRAWGDERASRERSRDLASALGVEFIEDRAAATTHRFG